MKAWTIIQNILGQMKIKGYHILLVSADQQGEVDKVPTKEEYERNSEKLTIELRHQKLNACLKTL